MGALKYGRRSDDYTKPKIDLTSLVTRADFSMVPATDDPLSTHVPHMLMLGNGPDPLMGPNFKGAGNCEAVRVANNRLLLTGKYPGREPQETLDWVWSIYKTQATNFDPHGDSEHNGPGSDADTGMSSDVLLDYLHKVGTPEGVKVVAYGTIDPTNVVAVERAIAVSGGSVWVDILVQPGNQDEFNDGRPWTNTGEAPEGGHAVLGGGYVPSRRVGTWANEATLSDAYWGGEWRGQMLVQRVYLVIWPEHCTETFLASESAANLAAQFQAITGKSLVWPTVPPAPVPPVTVMTPDDRLADAIHAFLSHRHESAVNLSMAQAGQTWLQAKGL